MKKIFALFFLQAMLSLQVLGQNISDAEKHLFTAKINNTLSNSSTNYDVNFYRCNWEVDPAVQFISGNITTYFTITSSTNNILFDMNKALMVDSVIYHGSKISFIHNNNHSLQVNFPAAMPVGKKDSVTIFYKGVPPTANGSFITTQHNGTPVLWTLSEPYGAREWWPCKDMLTDKADSIDIIITYPSQYRSSSNGLPVKEIVNGTKKTEYWQHRYPIVSYLVAIAVTNYTVDNDSVALSTRTMPVVMYAYPENETTFKTATNIAKASLQTFSQLVGEYPFNAERYAQTQFSWGGGMEHQTNSFIVSPNAKLVAHELAHQWFGDKVTTASWQHLWLNEGFATYFEHLYVELIEKSSVINHLQGLRNSIISSPAGSVFITDTNNINRLFDSRLTYKKAGYLVHMLRWKLEDTLFFMGLRQYLNDPALAFKSARTEDLQRNLENISGQNLTEFFEDWLYGQGYPNYSAEWSQQTSGEVQVKLFQTTSHPSVDFYEMPVPLVFRNATNDTTIIVNHTFSGQSFTANLSFKADTLLIDPELWILTKDKTTNKTSATGSQSFNKLTVFPNPAQQKITVYLPPVNNQKITLKLVNAIGQAVHEKTLNTSGDEQLEIFTKGLSSGIYWLQVLGDDDFKEVKKIMIINK